ncbi:MAG: alpha/beta fold hydrolase [Rhodospirillaceae bacterium]|nr:alpha/beta fold hydrolase [Rhodospirillaceae bacterium]
MTAPHLLAFRPRFPWVTGDLQTVRNTALDRLGRGPRPPAGLARRIEIPCRDGTGDRLLALLDEPPQAVDDGLVLLLHGLTGCEDSPYMRATARLLVAAGRRVVRLNLRGAGPSRATCGQHYHAGRGGDVAIAIAGLAAAGLGQVRVAVGYSLGASILLNHLADAGRDTPLRLAMTVSAPIDLMATSACMLRPRNRAYHLAILADMKRELRGSAAPAELTAAALRARTVRAFDDALIAPWNGFGTVHRYYEQCSAVRRLGEIAVDTLLVHAADDPWIPLGMFRAVDWASHPRLLACLFAGGGHVGFHDAGHTAAAHDRLLLRWLEGKAAGGPASGVGDAHHAGDLLP